ncbi:MAG TPA: GNAT family N-acetyltransferase [Thermoplasmata archaeon]|nr:GNAT family N-acetyltransferase [Thermoplasmata archaeon]
MRAANSLEVEAALDSERQFVLTLGGLALEIAGATLVTHEKLPVPRFNFVQELGVGRERQSAFFERALDHYFQRALRPTFRVPTPVAPHVDAGLRRFGFRPRAAPLVLMLDAPARRTTETPSGTVRPAEPAEVDLVASFWTAERERPEFRAALEVAWSHPNPHERLQPLLAERDGEVVAAAIVYRYRTAAGIHAVATRPAARGHGAASELVGYALAADPVGAGLRYSIFSDSARLEHRLATLGFAAAREFREYELPADAQLAFPPAGPASGPRWRPPRAP